MIGHYIIPNSSLLVANTAVNFSFHLVFENKIVINIAMAKMRANPTAFINLFYTLMAP